MSLIVECQSGEVRSYNEIYTGYGVEGIAQYCDYGVWTTLCDDGTNSNDGVGFLGPTSSVSGRVVKLTVSHYYSAPLPLQKRGYGDEI